MKTTLLFALLFLTICCPRLHAQCTNWQVSPTSAAFYASGGSGSFTVSTTGGGCSYTAQSSDLSVVYNVTTSGATISFDVASNSSCSAITAYVYIYDQYGNYQTYFEVDEQAGCCTNWAVTPGYGSFGSGGGAGSFDVSTDEGGCSYSASSSNLSFIYNVTSSGSTVSFEVYRNNTCSPLTGYIYVYDANNVYQATYEVDEAAGCCTNWAASPAYGSFLGSGGSGSFTVTTDQGGCYYNAVSSDINYIYNVTISGATVSYDVYANPTCNSLTGYINIYDANNVFQTSYEVDQDGDCCTNWQTTPNYANVSGSNESGSFEVTADPGGCGFTATDVDSWIHPQTTGGSGTVTYVVDANPYATGRSTTVYIRDASQNQQTSFQLYQDGASGITEFSVKNLSISPNASTGTFILSFEIPQDNEIQIRIYNVLGQLIMEQAPEQASGVYKKQVDVGNVAKGTYLLQIKSNCGVENKLIEIQ